MEKIDPKLWTTSGILNKPAQSNESPNRQTIAQSSHPAHCLNIQMHQTVRLTNVVGYLKKHFYRKISNFCYKYLLYLCKAKN
jgi:hypothetical protein